MSSPGQNMPRGSASDVLKAGQVLNDGSKKIRDLEILLLEIENNRMQMERIWAEVKKLRSNRAALNKIREKAANV